VQFSRDASIHIQPDLFPLFGDQQKKTVITRPQMRRAVHVCISVVYVCVCVRTSVSSYVCASVYMCVHVRVYVCVCEGVYVCVCEGVG